MLIAWGQSYSGFDMSVSTLENLLKVMKEKLSQQDINHTMMLAIDEIIREVKRLDVEIRKAKRTINRRF
jgi:H2-forming N5,N10-methylenetetrahydromethanopterin dehydrogenase-like enzyme